MAVVRRDAPIGDALAAAIGGSAVAGFLWASAGISGGLATVQIAGASAFTAIAALGWTVVAVPSLVRREVSFDGDVVVVRGSLGREVVVALSNAEHIVAVGCTGPDESELSLELRCGRSIARLRQRELFESGVWDAVRTMPGFRPEALATVWPRSARFLDGLRSPRAVVFERERGPGAYRRGA